MTYTEYVTALDTILQIGVSFDIIKRNLKLPDNKNAALYFIDGLTKDEISVRLFEYLAKSPLSDIDHNIPYTEVDGTDDIDRMVTAVLSGSTVLIADGLEQAKIIDTRTYPVRSVTEPENDKVLRGARDGFTETIVFNTALIRRRIRDPNLVVSMKTIGDFTRSDIVVCYINGRADPKFVGNINKKLDEIKVKALNFAEESLSECLIKRKWYNPFPKIRYTERPDAAAAMLLEGSVLIICDNSPSVMILPTSIFDFLQESDDFHLSPFTSSYLRIIRLAVFLTTVFATPTWYLFIKNPDWIPAMFKFISVNESKDLPIIVQLLLIEISIDGLKMAALNTPSTLNSSLSIVGGLILGDFAVKSGWFIPQTILYMAIVTIANYTQPSYELGYAFKFARIFLLISTALFNIWGYAAGIVLIIVFIASNKTVDGSRSYLYPLIPWNGQAMKRLLTRVRLKIE